MTKKILSILLALSMALTMLAACNKEPVEDVENPNDQQGNNEVVQGDTEIDDGTLKLVVEGVSDYVIVRGENAYISEVTASTELQKYLKQISGVEIPIVTDTTAPVEKEIVVGKTNREADGEFDRDELGDEGFVIKSEAEKLFIVGGEQRGTLYGVYEFLEAYLGCGFYTANVEKVPETKTISLGKIEEDKQIPVFEYRETDWYNYYSPLSANNLKVKHRINASLISEEYGGCVSPGTYGFLLWCHTFQTLVPPAQYYSEHPEYFAMDKSGNRIAGEYGNAGLDSQLCMSNPDVTQVLIENTRSYLRNVYGENPQGYFSLSINDNRNYCRCPECERIYAEDGGTTDIHLRAVNAVATALKDEFPNVTFEFLAYFQTRAVPTSVKAAENVVVRLAFIEECFSHPLEECTAPAEGDSGVQKAAIEIKEWANCADKIFIWDYTCNYDNYSAPFPNFDTLLKNERYYADNNVKGIFHEGPLGGGNTTEFGDLRMYLLSKVLWNPYMTEEEYYGYMDEFLEYVYGPGWESIREYIDLIHELTEDVHIGCFESDLDEIFDLGEAIEVHDAATYPEDLTAEMIINYETVDWSKYWNYYKDIPEVPEIIAEGERLFALAMEQAETELQKQHLDKSYIQVEYLKSCYLKNRLSKGNGAIGKIIANFYKANPDAVDPELQSSLRVAILRLANEQVYSSYIEYNRALAEKLLAHDIVLVRINHSFSNVDSLLLENEPYDWFD